MKKPKSIRISTRNCLQCFGPLPADRLTILCGKIEPKSWGAKIYLKREDLTLELTRSIMAFGQALLAKRMGKQRIITKLVLDTRNCNLSACAVLVRYLHGCRRHATAGLECFSNEIMGLKFEGLKLK